MEIEEYKTQEEVKKWIKKCEGEHVQQIAYSSYHDALTQVCFDCKKVRTNLIFMNKTKKQLREEMAKAWDKAQDAWDAWAKARDAWKVWENAREKAREDYNGK